MKLIPNWKSTVARAWSLRFMAAAAVFSGAETALPYLDWLPMPRGLFAALSAFATVGGLVSRIVLQTNIKREPGC